ncbi:MAG: hypothetical protein WDW36_003356 [Sanguina aurantia]
MASIATVSGSAASSTTDDLLAEGYLFKETLAAEVVVRRFVRLYLSRFDTFHNFAIDPRDKRSWLLDRHCELEPRNAEDIKTGKRYIRPGKVWSVTASLGAGNLKQVQLYYFELAWPTSWAVNGYTTFMFGCETAAESQRWHGLLAGRIAALKEISLLGKSHKKFGQHSRQTSASGLVQASSSSLTIHPELNPCLSHRGGAAGNVNGTDADALQRGLQTLSPPPQPSAGNSAGELRRGGRMSSLRARLRACPRACVQFWDRDSPASRSGTLFPRPALQSAHPTAQPPKGVHSRHRPASSRVCAPKPHGFLDLHIARAGPPLQRTSASSAPDEFFDPVNGGGRGVGPEDEDDEEEGSYSVGGEDVVPEGAFHAAGPGLVQGKRWVPYRWGSPPCSGPGWVLRGCRVAFPTRPGPVLVQGKQGKRWVPYGWGSPPCSGPGWVSRGCHVAFPTRPGPVLVQGKQGKRWVPYGWGSPPCSGPGWVLRGCHVALPTRPGPGLVQGKRWVPYGQTNGVAIYHHESPPGESCGGCAQEHRASVGGEYMASTVVRGTPSAVLQASRPGLSLDTPPPPSVWRLVVGQHRVSKRWRGLGALLHGSSSSILGPASHVKVVSRVSLPGLDSEVLHITLEAPGYAGVFCAPRELRVERMVKVDETGLFVVMFKSLDGQQPPTHPAAAVTTTTTTATSASDGSSDSGRSFYKRSVTGWVRGGYTIAPRAGFSSDDSPDSLITCILKVDLGGACSPASWLRPLSDSLGWTDAFVDRILMSIQLVRDEVEHRGFVSTPFAVTGTQERRKGPARASVSSTSADVSAASVLAPTTSAPLATAAPIGGFRRTMSKQRKSAVNWVSLTDAEKAAASAASPALLPLPEHDGDAHAAGLEALSLLEHTRAMSTLGRKFWEPIHSEGTASPFMVRGATYLKDKRKVAAGLVECPLASYDFVQLVAPIEDIARFLPSVIRSPFPFSIVINIVIPGNPPISSAATFGCTRHPASMGEPPLHPMQGGHDWAPFDFLLHRFYYGSDAVRDSMLKLIPHIAEGSWVIRQSIGTTPAILGKALKTTYHVNDRYMEVDVDISANSVANYITGLARGTTRSMVIDMGFLLEGTSPWELPESLLGAVRLVRLDMKGNLIDLVNEVPKAEQ